MKKFDTDTAPYTYEFIAVGTNIPILQYNYLRNKNEKQCIIAE